MLSNYSKYSITNLVQKSTLHYYLKVPSICIIIDYIQFTKIIYQRKLCILLKHLKEHLISLV